jgi:hypothetical protein
VVGRTSDRRHGLHHWNAYAADTRALILALHLKTKRRLHYFES